MTPESLRERLDELEWRVGTQPAPKGGSDFYELILIVQALAEEVEAALSAVAQEPNE